MRAVIPLKHMPTVSAKIPWDRFFHFGKIGKTHESGQKRGLLLALFKAPTFGPFAMCSALVQRCFVIAHP
jgi:hypothetical protein